MLFKLSSLFPSGRLKLSKLTWGSWEVLGPWDQPCFCECTLHVSQGLYSSQEKRAVQFLAVEVVVQLNSSFPPKTPTSVLQIGLNCINSFTWAACLREVVIICVFEHKPWWDCTPCLKCLLFFWLFFGFFLFKEPHWSPLYPLMCPTGNSPVFKSTICCTKAYS